MEPDLNIPSHSSGSLLCPAWRASCSSFSASCYGITSATGWRREGLRRVGTFDPRSGESIDCVFERRRWRKMYTRHLGEAFFVQQGKEIPLKQHHMNTDSVPLDRKHLRRAITYLVFRCVIHRGATCWSFNLGKPSTIVVLCR